MDKSNPLMATSHIQPPSSPTPLTLMESMCNLRLPFYDPITHAEVVPHSIKSCFLQLDYYLPRKVLLGVSKAVRIRS